MRRLRLLAVCGSLLLAGCGDSGSSATTTTAAGGVRYGVIGDSYSNGEAVGADRAWPTLLAQRLHLDLVVNPAQSGWTFQLAIDRELPLFAAAKPQVATLLIGVNDLVQGVAPAQIRANVRTLLTRMIAVVGGADRVLLVTVPDFSVKPAGRQFGNPSAISQALRRLNALVTAEGRRAHVAVADIFTVSRRPTDPSPDGLHPSARELEAWTDVIEPVARRTWAGVLG